MRGTFARRDASLAPGGLRRALQPLLAVLSVVGAAWLGGLV